MEYQYHFHIKCDQKQELLNRVEFPFLFFLIIIADTLHENAHAFPVLLVWLPNLIFTGVGIWLFSRLARR